MENEVAMKHIRTAFALTLALILCACSMPKPGMVRDLKTLPQDAHAYHGLESGKPLLSTGVQAAFYADFLRRHYAPWRQDHQPLPAEQAFWALEHYAGKALYGQNTLKRSEGWLDTVARRSDRAAYPSLNRPCIAVTNTSMRSLPTLEPAFYDFEKAGEGFPFDYMQNSLVLAGTPLRAMHESTDGAWVLVESRFAFGWVPLRDIAWVDKPFMAAFNAPGQIAITRDSVPVTDIEGQFRFTGHIGTTLPLAQRPGDGPFTVILPARDEHGNAVAVEAHLDRDRTTLMPMMATPENFALLANAMLGRPYGWGGLYQDRDCSATLMDLMTPFGIYLPRNSSQQYNAGLVSELTAMSRKHKKQIIREHGVPFLTLVRSPGHIMLYIGQRKGDPVVLQTMWGIKTQFLFSDVGRHVIGRTVITTLEPGKEMPTLAPGTGNALNTVYGISLIGSNKHWPASPFRRSDERGR